MSVEPEGTEPTGTGKSSTDYEAMRDQAGTEAKTDDTELEKGLVGIPGIPEVSLVAGPLMIGEFGATAQAAQAEALVKQREALVKELPVYKGYLTEHSGGAIPPPPVEPQPVGGLSRIKETEEEFAARKAAYEAQVTERSERIQQYSAWKEARQGR